MHKGSDEELVHCLRSRRPNQNVSHGIRTSNSRRFHVFAWRMRERVPPFCPSLGPACLQLLPRIDNVREFLTKFGSCTLAQSVSSVLSPASSYVVCPYIFGRQNWRQSHPLAQNPPPTSTPARITIRTPASSQNTCARTRHCVLHARARAKHHVRCEQRGDARVRSLGRMTRVLVG